MIASLAPVAALLLSTAFLLTGNGLQNTLVPIRADIEAFSTYSIGIMGAVYFLGFGTGCVLAPRIVRRTGHIRAFAAMSAIASTTALAHALILLPAAWWVFRGMTGFCFAALYVVIESWLNERSSNENRGAVLSVYNVINLTVITVGQMMVTLYDPASFPLFILASILVSLAAVPVAMTVSVPPAPVQIVEIPLVRLFRVTPVAVVGTAAVGAVNGAFWTLSPVFARESGLNVTGVALFMSIAVLGGAAGQWPLGRLSDRIDRRIVIIAASLIAATASLTMDTFGVGSVMGLLLFSALFGLGAFPLYALCVAHTNDRLEPHEFVQASSALLLLYGAGAVVGPLIGSVLMTGIGPMGLYVFTASVHGLTALYALARLRFRTAISAEDKEQFQPVPRTSATVYAIDPRSEESDEERAAADDNAPAEPADTGDEPLVVPLVEPEVGPPRG